MKKSEIIKKLKNKVVISVQAMPTEPLYDEICILAMAKSAVMGGAGALRLAGVRDIKNVKREMPDTIVIGITKPSKIPDNYKELVYITPTVEDAKKIIEAGADIVAFDGTTRNRSLNKDKNTETLADLIKFIKNEGNVAMADIATFDEAKNAFELGADIVSTTLSGYTKETETMPETPDFNLLERISKELKCPVILEGKIWSPEEVTHAFKLGATAVVIGSAATRVQVITKRFVNAIKNIEN